MIAFGNTVRGPFSSVVFIIIIFRRLDLRREDSLPRLLYTTLELSAPRQFEPFGLALLSLPFGNTLTKNRQSTLWGEHKQSSRK